MEFIDRVSAYPNRYKMTDEEGNVSHVVLERDDDPILEGTPLNAETFNSLYLYSEHGSAPGCYFRTVDGEQEFMNPPMFLNTVQRTTKRFKGYPVYTVAIHIPNLKSAGESFKAELSSFTHIVSISTTYYMNENGKEIGVYPNPWIDADGVYATTRVVNKNMLEIKSGNMNIDYSNCSAVCIVEVTKEEAL